MGGAVEMASDVYSFGVLMYEVGGSAALDSSIKCMRWATGRVATSSRAGASALECGQRRSASATPAACPGGRGVCNPKPNRPAAQVITGERPKRGCLRLPRVPDECCQQACVLMVQCLSLDPAARPTAADLLRRLERLHSAAGADAATGYDAPPARAHTAPPATG